MIALTAGQPGHTGLASFCPNADPAGHSVHVPDLYPGSTFADLAAGRGLTRGARHAVRGRRLRKIAAPATVKPGSNRGVIGLGYRGLLPSFFRMATLAVVYWVVARLSLALALVHGQVTPIWPPTGIALVAILVYGPRMWPAIFVGALAVNLPIGPSPEGAALIAAGNTAAPLVAAALLRRVGFRIELDRLRDAAAIIGLGALAAMTVSATIGTAVLVLSGTADPGGFWPTWAVWWGGDAMGVLIVAPYLLSLLPGSPGPRLTPRTAGLLAGLIAGIGVVTAAVFLSGLRIEYLVFPLIMVAAWRYRLRGAAPAALVASGIAIWSAVNGIGPFAGGTLTEKMITLQVFNVCVALTSFVLASFVATRERQQEAMRLYASATAASEAKSAFLTLAAHEFRTPIAVINGYLSMLSDGSLGAVPGGWARPLHVLDLKTAELTRLVDTLVQASLIEAGHEPAATQLIDLRRIVEDAAVRARPRADLLHADIATRVAGTAVMVEADRAELGRLLDNLINNSLSYSNPPARLAIDLSAEAGRAVVRVEDNGVGIPADQLDNIFDRFFRGPGPKVSKVPGVGLGLYIGRQLAEHNGGQLVVERSTPGEGSVFALAIPLAG
jgi:signal transduction histidine kinase